MKHSAIKLFSCITLCITLSACTDGASVTAGADGSANDAAFDFSGVWRGTMTPNPNNSGAEPANIILTITQNTNEVTVEESNADEEDNMNSTETRIEARGVADIDGRCWDGGAISGGQAAGTTVSFSVIESTGAETSIEFAGQFLGDRIEGSFFSNTGTCGNTSGTWTATR